MGSRFGKLKMLHIPLFLGPNGKKNIILKENACPYVYDIGRKVRSGDYIKEFSSKSKPSSLAPVTFSIYFYSPLVLEHSQTVNN